MFRTKLPLVLAASSAIFLLFSSAQASGEPAKLRVGAILPMVGPFADVGLAFKNGLELGWSALEPEYQTRISLSFEDVEKSRVEKRK